MLAGQLLPLLTPFSAVWSVVSADFSALIWVLNAPCASPASALSLACASFRSAFTCVSVPVPPLALARSASGACRAPLSWHSAVLAFVACAGLLAWWLAVTDGAELPDVVPLDPHAPRAS